MAKTTTERVLELMNTPKKIRNIGIVAHIDHGKTTLSDNLLAGAGMLSEEIAGKALFLDSDEQESARGITIDAANVSMIHNIGEDHLINLIDTPGHVDFGGDVTRAMRAVDGAVVVTCAVEGVMPQTENVLKQAIKERVKPILFINKVDRLIKEIKLTPEKMQARFIDTINEINKIIRSLAPPEFKEKWQVNVADGSVAFGSAFHNWAVSIPVMKNKGVSFKDIIDAYQSDDLWRELRKKVPLHEALLNMVIKHLPDPIDAQKYRIPKIWRGDPESTIGKSLLSANPKGPLAFVVTKITVDKQAGEIAAGRLFSGTMKKGQDVYVNSRKTFQRIQQVSIYKGPQRLVIDNVPAGNIIGVTGLKNIGSGETISAEPVEEFESIKHLFEPVVTKAIEAKSPKDLPKLIDALKEISKEDPTLRVEINEETGENLISGLGELHLEIWEYRIRKGKGVEIVTSPPIVVYRESVKKHGGPFEGKSPNKHNKLYVAVEPLDDSIFQKTLAGELPEIRIKKKRNDIIEKLVDAGMDKDEARKVRSIYKGNVLIDATRGIVHINEIMEMVLDSFEEIINAGPLAKEPGVKLKIRLTDAKLHEDSIHRGPAQIIPAMRHGIMGAMTEGSAIIYEPIQTIRIDAPLDYLGAVSKLIQSRRGQLVDTQQEGEHLTIVAKTPVAEMFGFTSSLRSATAGRGAWFLVDQNFVKLPEELQPAVVQKIRQRKGLKAGSLLEE